MKQMVHDKAGWGAVDFQVGSGAAGWRHRSVAIAPAAVLLGMLASLSAMAVAQTGAAAAGAAAAPAPAAQPGTPLTLPSGVQVLLVKPGRSPSRFPAATDTVKVHYEGTFDDGRVFDSSYERKQPATFPLNRVIPCWTQGVQQIPVGATATLKCPSATAYGERGAGGGAIPPNTPLNFKVELLEVVGR